MWIWEWSLLPLNCFKIWKTFWNHCVCVIQNYFAFNKTTVAVVYGFFNNARWSESHLQYLVCFLKSGCTIYEKKKNTTFYSVSLPFVMSSYSKMVGIGVLAFLSCSACLFVLPLGALILFLSDKFKYIFYVVQVVLYCYPKNSFGRLVKKTF